MIKIKFKLVLVTDKLVNVVSFYRFLTFKSTFVKPCIDIKKFLDIKFTFRHFRMYIYKNFKPHWHINILNTSENMLKNLLLHYEIGLVFLYFTRYRQLTNAIPDKNREKQASMAAALPWSWVKSGSGGRSPLVVTSSRESYFACSYSHWSKREPF